MSAEIAEKFGKTPSIKTAPARCPPDSGISGLATYLTAAGAKTLEQEELDPTLPELSGAQNLGPTVTDGALVGREPRQNALEPKSQERAVSGTPPSS
jgi:hypothetical protein